MKRIFLRLKQPLRNERGEITFFACFFVVGIVMLISFLLLYASIRITCINIRNGAKMELNNLSGTIYADTYRSQRETNFEEYLNTLYSSSDYTDMLEATVAGGLDSKIPLSTEDYKVSDISLDFNVEDAAHFCRLHTCQNSIHGQYAEWRHHRPTLREAYSALARLPHGHIPFHCQPAAAHPVAWRKPLPDFQFVSCSAPSFFINDRTPSRMPGHSHFVTLQQPMPETGCYPCFPSGLPSAHPPKAFLPNGRYE